MNFRKFIIILLFLSAGYSIMWAQGNLVLDYQTKVRVEKNKLVEENFYLIQINNKSSDWISAIEIPYTVEDKLEITEASILNSKGIVVRTLPKKEITTRSDISRGVFYEDNLVKAFNLKWNEYPYLVRYSYIRTTENFVYVTKWYPVLYTNVPVIKASLQVQLPLGYPARFNFSDDFEHSMDSREGSQIATWSIGNINPIPDEVFSAPYTERIPSVAVIPEKFKYELEGSFASWSSYGIWQTNLNAHLDELTPEESVKVDNLTRGLRDKKEIVKNLYNYMQDNTRYINVSIDVGGLKPYPASYVCTNKYGDCKALTIYMKALLKHAGIESFYTKVYAGENPKKIEVDYPSQQFNHVILAVPLEGDTLWLENTSNYLPFNYMGTFTQNRIGFLVNGSESRLVKIPALKMDDVLEVNTYRIQINKEGEGGVTAAKEINGSGFEYYQYLQNELSESEKRKGLLDQIPLRNVDVQRLNFIQKDRSKPNMTVEALLKASHQFRNLGDNLIIDPSPMTLPEFESPSTRSTPVRINFPVNKRDTIVYLLPFVNEFAVTLPEEVRLDSIYGSYSQTFNLADGEIRVIRNFQLISGHYSVAEFPGLYNFINQIKESTRSAYIVLKPQ